MATKKQEILDLVSSMPDDADYDDVMAKLYFKQTVENSLNEIDQNKTVSHDQAKARLSKWIQ
ncbi:MAG: hypothetical protein P9L94_01140 [Candidatus Hinthialibacter antarcticus]|nr:hypothetical protein [Candidatus Hinthialibacter antarcticus]